MAFQFKQRHDINTCALCRDHFNKYQFLFMQKAEAVIRINLAKSWLNHLMIEDNLI